VEAATNNGWTILHSAAENGHVDVARLLLDRGMRWYGFGAALKLDIMQE
jgi:ankyrin repeat protein